MIPRSFVTRIALSAVLASAGFVGAPQAAFARDCCQIATKTGDRCMKLSGPACKAIPNMISFKSQLWCPRQLAASSSCRETKPKESTSEMSERDLLQAARLLGLEPETLYKLISR